jgi:hypothetical protein
MRLSSVSSDPGRSRRRKRSGGNFTGLAKALEDDDGGELRGRLQDFMSCEGIAELGLGRSLDDIRAAFRARELALEPS